MCSSDLEAWRADSGLVPAYEAGNAGPPEADALIGPGREWRKL